MILRRLTPIRAVRAISVVTLLVTLASGAAMRLADGKEFPTIGRGLWWAAQTVTTVGYGDVVPRATAGRVLAVFVMVSAIAFLTVFTAAITATLIERERRRLPTGDSPIESQLREISDRLARLQECLRARDLLDGGLLDEASHARLAGKTRDARQACISTSRSWFDIDETDSSAALNPAQVSANRPNSAQSDSGPLEGNFQVLV